MVRSCNSFILAFMNGLTWLGENGDSIIIWKKSKKK